MDAENEVTSALVEFAATIRGAAEPLLLLDIARCLLFLRYAASSTFRFSRDDLPLVIPNTARWPHLRRCEHDLAAALERACRDLEQANPVLEGAFAGVDFTPVERWDGDRRDRILKQLIEITSKLPSFDTAARIGEVYDSLVLMFAENTGKGGAGEMFLSVPLAKLMSTLLDLRDGMRVCDPICRAGRTLVACATHARERGLDIALYGQDPNKQLGAICRMNLILHGARTVTIAPGDVLHSPMLTGAGALRRFDRVLMAPPINRANWGAEDATADRLGRFPFVPPKHNGDYAYIMHCLASLEDEGRAVVLAGRGVLFRQGGEELIREMLVQGDHFEAIVGLPGGLLYGTHIPAALLVLRKGKSRRSGKVLFVDVRRSSERRSRHEALLAEEIDAITACVRGFEDVGGMSRAVDLDEIARNEWILNPAVYVSHTSTRTDIDFAETTDAIQSLEAERDEAAARVDELLRELAEQIER